MIARSLQLKKAWQNGDVGAAAQYLPLIWMDGWNIGIREEESDDILREQDRKKCGPKAERTNHNLSIALCGYI
jgi:hypothetical protein